MISNVEKLGSDNEGARIVARAWTNPEFKEKLLTDANSAIE